MRKVLVFSVFSFLLVWLIWGCTGEPAKPIHTFNPDDRAVAAPVDSTPSSWKMGIPIDGFELVRPACDFPMSNEDVPDVADRWNSGAGTTLVPNGIPYHGGPILFGTVRIYIVWYGNWPEATRKRIKQFVRSISGSPYFNILTTYYTPDLDRRHRHCATGKIELKGEVFDSFSRGTQIEDDEAAVMGILIDQLRDGSLPYDTNGIYLVIADPSIRIGFSCVSWCAWHDHAVIDDRDLKFGLILDPTACPSNCTRFEIKSLDSGYVSPNDDLSADGVENLLAHEVEETITDPDLNAWLGEYYYENADRCSWDFGSTYRTPNGALANMNLDGVDYLIQRNWVNAAGGYCGFSYP